MNVEIVKFRVSAKNKAVRYVQGSLRLLLTLTLWSKLYQRLSSAASNLDLYYLSDNK